MFQHLFVAALAFSSDEPANRVVVVTGATGRTGALLYKALLHQPHTTTRAIVTSVEKARAVLNCSACDESEGIFVGNVTQLGSLTRPMHGATHVAIAVGASPSISAAGQRAVEWEGVKNTVAALASQPRVKARQLRVVLCSSMGTTEPSPDARSGGSILFWKLQAEAFLMSSGLEYAIVKPCGLLSTAAAGQNTLLVGHDDTLLSTAPPIVQRADVAAVMRQALISDTTNLRFDLCSQRGEPNPDLEGILQEARFSWCQHGAC